MNGKANEIKKEFTNDHRRNYTNYNSSNIFNTDIVIKENELVTKYKNKNKEQNFTPKYSNENATAFSRKLNEYYDGKSLETGKENQAAKLNSTLGYLRTQDEKLNEAKRLDGNVSAKEKKFLELNPNLKEEQLKELKEKNSNSLKMNQNKVKLDFEAKQNNSRFNRIKTNTSNIFHDKEKARQIENYSTNPNNCVINLDGMDLGSGKGEIDIISNEVKKSFPKTPKAKRTINTQANDNAGEYVANLINKKDDPKIKKRLNLISSLDNYEKINYNTCLTEGNIESKKDIDSEYFAKKKNEIKECISKKLNTGNNNKLRKIMDQTSSLFDNKIYESNYSAKNNNRDTYKFELIPKDDEKNGKLLSSEEIKLIFAKKGHEFSNEPNKAENIKISIRKTENLNDEKLKNIIAEEATKFGFEIGSFKEKETLKKGTDVIPYNSHWDNPVLNGKLKKRLKIHEKDPEPPKAKLDNLFKNQKFQQSANYKNKYIEDKKKREGK